MERQFSVKLRRGIIFLVVTAVVLSVSVYSDLSTTQHPAKPPRPSRSPVPSLSINVRPEGSMGSESAVLGHSSREKAVITRIVDGDTVVLSDGRKLRYIGVDTPETVKPNAKVECFGKEATDANSKLVLGKEVWLEKDVSETDRYGRILRFVYLNDVLINEYLILEGFGYASTYPPDVKYSQKFKEAQRVAMEKKSGLWGANCPAHRSDKI